MSEKINKLDRSALKFNQGAIVLLTSIAFIFNIYWLVLFVAVVLLVGTLFPKAGLFKLIYFQVAKRFGIIKPQVVVEDNAPHLFAQGMGGVFLTISFLLLELTNQQFLGWTISIIVVVFAFVNIVLNFCAGCFIYFQLGKIGILPGKISEKQNA